MSSLCTVVLGMHRSGTSLVAGILSTLGIHMGTRFRAPDEHNSTGYFEDLDWRDLNRSILMELSSTWYRPPISAKVYSYIDKGKADGMIKRAASLASARSQYPSWGFKDPRTCITIPIISLGLPDDTQYIFVRREMDAVVESLTLRAEARGYYESPPHWESLYKDYNERIIEFIHGAHPKFIIITYEQLVNKEQSRFTVKSISDFVGVKDECLIKSACELVKFR